MNTSVSFSRQPFLKTAAIVAVVMALWIGCGLADESTPKASPSPAYTGSRVEPGFEAFPQFRGLPYKLGLSTPGAVHSHDTLRIKARIMLVALILLLPFTIGEICRTSGRSLALLVVLVAIGGALRWGITIPNILGAFDYTGARFTNVTRFIFMFELFGIEDEWFSLPMWDVNFGLNRFFGTMTIVYVYFHAKSWLRSENLALACALMLTFLPSHIKFSGSNVLFIQGLFWAAVGLGAFHAAMRSVSVRTRWFYVVFFLLVFVLNYFVRPLNFLYFPLYMIFVATAYRKRFFQLEERWILAGVYVLTGVYMFYWRFTHESAGFVFEYGWKRFLYAVFYVFDPTVNIFLNPTVSPVWLLGLALIGAVGLSLTRKLSAAALIGWVGLFFLVHLVVIDNIINQSRYLLHLVTPLILLAGAGVGFIADVLLTDKRPKQLQALLAKVFPKPFPQLKKPLIAAFTLIIATSPVVYWDFIRTADATRMREFSFLDEHINPLPDGTLVIEIDPMGGKAERRVRRFAQYWAFPTRYVRNRIQVEKLTNPDQIGAFYAGYIFFPKECYTYLPGENGLNPLCEEVMAYYDLETCATVTFENKSHQHMGFEGVSRYDTFPVTIQLSRIRGVKAELAPGPEEARDAPSEQVNEPSRSDMNTSITVPQS